MALYRFYWMDPDDHIKAAEHINCASDEAAGTVAAARQGDFAAVEVWLDQRRVTRVGQPEKTQRAR